MCDIEDNFNLLDVINLNDIAYTKTLITSLQHGLYDEKSSKTIISQINKKLSNAVTRDKGFEILFKLLPDLSEKILVENCILWTNFAISHHPNDPVPGRRFQCLAEILTLCYSQQDYYKCIVSSLLQKIIDSCINVNIKMNEAWHSMECLIRCLKHFSSTCIVYKKKIETYLTQLLDSSVSPSVIEQAAKCFHYLNQIGGSGPQGSAHIKNYTDHIEKLCNTLNFLYDDIFKNINEYQEYHSSDNTNVFDFRQIISNLNNLEVYRIVARRLRNITNLLTATFECGYEQKKSFNPQLLLSVIERGLTVHIHKNESDREQVVLSIVVQEHQIDILNLLKSLISCLKYNFIRFSTIKLLQDSLVKTKACSCFNGNSEYDMAIYEVLIYWINNSGEHIDLTQYENLLKNILIDITPVKASLVLNITNTDSKSKKAKVKIIHERIIKSGDGNKKATTKTILESNENICYKALCALELLLKKIPLNVKESTCSVLFEIIVKTLLDISVGIYEVPYTHQKCRHMLYKVLIAIFEQTKFSLDIGLAINLLHLGVCTDDFEISNLCTEGLSALEKLCQPINSSLYIDNGERQKPKEKVNEITEDVMEEEDIEMEKDNLVNTEKSDGSDISEITNYVVVEMDKDEKENIDQQIDSEENPKINVGVSKDEGISTMLESSMFLEEISSKVENKELNLMNGNKEPVLESALTAETNGQNSNTRTDSESNGKDKNSSLESEDEFEGPKKKFKINKDSSIELTFPEVKIVEETGEENIDINGSDVDDMLSSFVDIVNE